MVKNYGAPALDAGELFRLASIQTAFRNKDGFVKSLIALPYMTALSAVRENVCRPPRVALWSKITFGNGEE
jgi:hypothetical protein